MPRKLRFGMVGGGRGAFIGAVHRIAATMDGRAELVAGAFPSDPARSRASGDDLMLAPDRTYASYIEMALGESRIPPEKRLDFVVIVTPNHRHFEVARAFLRVGFHIVCDKPVTLTLAEAKQLRRLVRESGRIFVLTHNYVGNAMVKQARELVRNGTLGAIRKVIVEYPQGWLATRLEQTGHRQAVWKTDPKRSGAGGCVGDIGTHAEHLARYITGLHIESLCAELTTFVAGRKLDDDSSILLRYRGGAKGVLLASQICIGEDNNLNIRVHGAKASLEWRQEFPEELIVKHAVRPRETWRRAHAYTSEAAKRAARIPPGHPEGYLEAFGNIYRQAFRAIDAELAGEPLPADLDFPTIDDGVEGMTFIETAVKSAKAGAKWTKFPRLQAAE